MTEYGSCTNERIDKKYKENYGNKRAINKTSKLNRRDARESCRTGSKYVFFQELLI